jgi:hypothetical protein
VVVAIGRGEGGRWIDEEKMMNRGDKENSGRGEGRSIGEREQERQRGREGGRKGKKVSQLAVG